MKIILEFNCTKDELQKAMFEPVKYMDLWDSIIWELDYGEGESNHRSNYGLIKIKQEQ